MPENRRGDISPGGSGAGRPAFCGHYSKNPLLRQPPRKIPDFSPDVTFALRRHLMKGEQIIDPTEEK